MPLPFSIFSNYQAEAAGLAKRPEPGNAVDVVQEWLEGSAVKEAAETAKGIEMAAPKTQSLMESMKALETILTPAPKMGGSLLFRENPRLAGEGSFEAMGARPPEPAAETKKDAPLPVEAVSAGGGQEGWSANQAPNQISGRELAQLRVDMRQEIEEVKNDLFGAAMGVNALKDRLDGLEAQVVTQAMQAAAESLKSPSPAPTRDEIHAWVREWLQEHLPAAVQAAVEKALETVAEPNAAIAPSSDFFRMPTTPQGQNSTPVFSQAPMILSTRPS
jgi:hypothetical protein